MSSHFAKIGIMPSALLTLSSKILSNLLARFESEMHHPVNWVNDKNYHPYIPIPIGAVIINNNPITPPAYV